MPNVRVLIAEDHAVVREGTREILERDPRIAVVAEAEDGEQAVALAEQHKPDLMVLDLRLPKMTGIEVARRLRTIAPATRILVLSAYEDDDYVFAAMEAGASGYLLKTAHGDEVVGAIHGIMRGEVVLQPAVAARFMRRHHDGDRTSADSLTEREMEVLRLAALGLRNKEIAHRVQLSRRTVEGHLSHIFNKLSVGSRTEAILFGATHGWFALDHAALDASMDAVGGYRQ